MIPKNQTRRQFIKASGLGSGILLSGVLTNLACSASEKSGEDLLYSGFLNPPAVSRPFFRWWWNGNKVTKEEISRELQIMKAAGVGGVEINPVEMPEQVENLQGEGLVWLSDAWIDMLIHAMEEAHRMDMYVDLIVGTGWPFGGEFLTSEETIQGLKTEVHECQGPAKMTVPLPQQETDSNVKIEQIKLIRQGIGTLEEVIDLTAKANGKRQLTVDIPEGEYKLIMIIWQDRFREVMHGAPGGAGPVLDHFNKSAVEKYLNHMSDRLNARLNGGIGQWIRSFFCDSIELKGANWTGDFAEQFERRRGYDIRPYLPFVLVNDLSISGPFINLIRRVRFDHSKTLAELFTERFILTFHEWCNTNGTLSRYQAYGHPWLYTDLLNGNMIPDIPEGDQWLFNGGWQPWCDVDEIRYAIWNKYTTSAGHIQGRKIMSSEAMTNTSGVWAASLEYIKQATDMNFAAGINHLILHGFNYSPPEAGIPGWVRYGCYFNENNPWWPYLRYWSDYCARISYILQEARPNNQLAIMGPTPDIWSDDGLDRNAFNMEPWYLHCIWQAANHGGYGTDYVNSDVLLGAEVANGLISLGRMQYRALILCDIVTLPPDTAQKLVELQKKGAKIIFIGSTPAFSPGLQGMSEDDRFVKHALDEMVNTAIFHQAPGEVLKDSQQAFTDWTIRMLENAGVAPGIQISNPDFKLYQMQYLYPGKSLFFMCNVDREKVLEIPVDFKAKGKTIWSWNPETGAKDLLGKYSNGVTKIVLLPLESKLIVIEEASDSGISNTSSSWDLQLVKGANVGPWEVQLKPVEGKEFTILLNELKDLKDLPECAHFSGIALYQGTVNAAHGNFDALDLGRVHEIAEVKINGRDAGLRWYGQGMIDVHGLIKKGSNQIQIKVTTLMFNAMFGKKDDPVGSYWIGRNKKKETLPSGLIGPLTWYEDAAGK